MGEQALIHYTVAVLGTMNSFLRYRLRYNSPSALPVATSSLPITDVHSGSLFPIDRR